MGKAHRNLALVLRADRATDHERDGVGGSRLTFAEVTTNGQTRKTPDSMGNELARAVGECTASKPPVLGNADMLVAPHTIPHCRRGCSASCDPARLLSATSDTAGTVR